MGGGGILDNIVEQGRLDGFRIQLQFLGHDLGHRQGVDDIGLAAFALLVGVGPFRVLVGGADAVKIRRRVIGAYGLFQQFILFL